MFKTLILISTFFVFFFSNLFADKINKIEVFGNERISAETIKLFSEIDLNKEFTNNDLNKVLKNLYNTNFFKDIKLELSNDTLFVYVVENPIIQSVTINGIKAKKIKDPILNSLSLKNNNSFNEFLAKQDKDQIVNILKNSGYYFSEVKLSIIKNNNNTLDLVYDIDLGKKAKIRKIKFIGDKKFKNRKLYNVIVSEENKFWKFLSSSKLLNQERINLDNRLLESFYKNKGYYNVRVENSFAEYLNNGKFDLIFNINAGKKFYFNELKLILPNDYDRNYFTKIDDIFTKIKGKPYSYNSIERILKSVEEVALNDQFESISANVEESIVNDQLNFTIIINEIKKEYVERINILGNNITREEVLRNNLILDEGDAFNEILLSKTVNNLKSLNFFRNVKSNVVKGSSENQKIINIEVEEKPTGEISAGVGVGTSGGTVGFGVKENNFLGRGIEFSTNIEFTEETIQGNFNLVNPNFRGSDQTLIAGLQSSTTDRLTVFGYKTDKTGFQLGTRFEYFEDFFVSPKLTSFYEDLETSSTASANIKKQEGSYFDTGIIYILDYDKRNQKFQTTDGFRSKFRQSLPILSETYSIVNGYEFVTYHELTDGMVGTFNFYSQAINSLSGEDVRISERLYMPSSKLRGFERGKIGPVDNNDYVGGNYVTSINIAATLPNVVPSIQNADFSVFFDAGNVWGVDYSSAVDESNQVRSSVGVAIDWYTVIGPLSFSYAGALSKASTDKEESFRFNIGTTF